MKKQIFSLMFSVSLFAACPSFAMEGDNDLNNESQIIQSKFSKLPIKWEILEEAQREGEGNFRHLLNNGNKKAAFGLIVEYLSLNDILNFLKCSKSIYNWINSDYSWKIIAKKYAHLIPREMLETEHVTKTSHKAILQDWRSLFANSTQSYKLTIGELLSWEETGTPVLSNSEDQTAYQIIIGKRRFQVLKTKENQHLLEGLHPNSTVTFTPHDLSEIDMNTMLVTKKRNGFSSFFHINLNRDNTNIEDLSSEEYGQRIKNDFLKVLSGEIVWHPQGYTIEQIKEEE